METNKRSSKMKNVITVISPQNNRPSSDELVKMIKSTKGKWFSCTFIKKDGSKRVMNGRIGCHKGVKGIGRKFQKENLVTVFDAQVKEYRMINVDTMLTFNCGGFTWKVE